jgi:hypothetical protein
MPWLILFRYMFLIEIVVKVTFPYASLWLSRVFPCLRSYTLTRAYIVTFPRRIVYVLLHQRCTSHIVIGTSDSCRGYVSCYGTSQLVLTCPNLFTYSSYTLGYGIHNTYSIRTVGTTTTYFVARTNKQVPRSLYGTGIVPTLIRKVLPHAVCGHTEL